MVLQKIQSDAYGNFRITLPFKEGHESRVRVYTNNVMRFNYEKVLSSQTSMTFQIQ